MFKYISIASVLLLTACSDTPNPQLGFVKNLSTLCDQNFIGQVVSNDAVDADWKASEIEVGPVECGVADIRMPLRVGVNTSRTWIIIPDRKAITLKHDHRHSDGSPDAVTLYGGTTDAPGTANRQEFPVDDYSIELFNKEGLAASVTNTWAMEITPGQTLAYELSRPRTEEQIAAGDKRGRFFRVEFDLKR
ncbi:hypothetical protein [Fretibacter rubidus]|uniref:hypothetical protein n=1 Tax=Fretibacter rubidus TaxID=570162 RepID=UPI00352A6D31